MFTVKKTTTINGDDIVNKDYFKEYYDFKRVMKAIHGINIKKYPALDAAFQKCQSTIKSFRKNIKSPSNNLIEYAITYTGRGFTTESNFTFSPHRINQYKIDYKNDPTALKNSLDKYGVVGQFKKARQDCLTQFKHFRVTRRTPRVRSRSTNFRAGRNFDVKTVGYTHTEKDSIYNLHLLRLSQSIFEYKKPKDDRHYMGIELEFFTKANKDLVAAEVMKAKLEKYVHIHDDGSIQADRDHVGIELSILTPEDEMERVVKGVCGVLTKVGAKVNASCGMHVHVDMRKRDKDIVFNNLVSSQPLLYAMNPKSRLVNRFCKKNKDKTIKEGTNREERYFGINAQALKKHGTIEIRIHSGTVNEAKILNWAKLLQRIVSQPEKIKRGPRTFRTFIKNFGIDLDLASYIAERIEKFNKEETDNEGSVAA
jgi:hypothetical protein